MLELFSYKMTDDTGLCSKPLLEGLDPRNCKFEIRLTKEIGDWIAGFTSK